MARRRLRSYRRVFNPSEQFTPEQVSGSFNIQDQIRTRGIDSINTLPPQSGLANTPSPDPGLNFNKTEAEKVIKNSKGNSYIVFGRDRPSSQLSGYGSIGASRCDTIDIVVGRMAAAREGRGAREGTTVENHFGLDAARIYISSLTDIDDNFGLEKCYINVPNGRSGIGIKADGVRVIGREGIKLTTGRSFAFKDWGWHGETNSRGGKMEKAPPIELNAGNQSKKFLQGVVLGDHTVKCVIELSKILETFLGGMLRSHTVMSAFATSLGTTPIPHHAAAGAISATEFLRISLEMLYALKSEVTAWHMNYMVPESPRYIVSRNVYAT